MRTGLKNLTKLYSQYGYIDYVGEPDVDFVPNTDKIDVTMNVDEGKQFSSAASISSATPPPATRSSAASCCSTKAISTTRSCGIMSILRLNQLGYFEAAEGKRILRAQAQRKFDTVDIVLKVKERGKNSISLNGGVSGISGTFVGLNYATNNFLGLGETLSLGGQVGTLMTNVTAGFTEPYLFDRPFQMGIQVYLRRFAYNQGQQESILAGTNVTAFYNSLGSANVLNYVQDSKGISLSFSYPLKRSFARLGIIDRL